MTVSVRSSRVCLSKRNDVFSRPANTKNSFAVSFCFLCFSQSFIFSDWRKKTSGKKCRGFYFWKVWFWYFVALFHSIENRKGVQKHYSILTSLWNLFFSKSKTTKKNTPQQQFYLAHPQRNMPWNVYTTHIMYIWASSSINFTKISQMNLISYVI